jgi:hypothetical protein
VFRQIQSAVLPAFPLAEVLRRWQELANDLAEPPRQRKLQAQRFESF